MADKKLQAKPKIVEVPGFGVIEFPGDMSDEAIAGQIRGLTGVAKTQGLFRRAAGFVREEGPTAVGAIGGGIAGAPAGPPGILAGAALGAMGASAIDQLARRALGQKDVPQTSAEASRKILQAGTTGVIQEGGGRVVNQLLKPVLGKVFGKKISSELAAAEEFGIPVKKGDVAPGEIRQALEGFVETTPLGRSAIRKFRLKSQIPEINRTIDEFVKGISKSNLETDQAGEAFISFLNLARKKVGDTFNKAVLDIAKQVPNASIRGKTILSETAGKLSNTLKGSTKEFESLLSVEDLKRAISILDDFASTGKTVKSTILDAAGKEVTSFIPRSIPIEKAINLRKLLFSISKASDTTIGKGTIKKLNQALTESIGEALERTGRKDLFNQFLKVSKDFRFVLDNLEKRSFKQILNQESPELVVDILLRRGASTRLNRVEKVFEVAGIPLGKLAPIRAAAVRKLFDDASREGIPISNVINDIERKIGTKTLKKLLGGDEVLIRFRRFSGLLDSIGLTRQLSSPQGGGAGIGLAIGGAAGGLVGGAAGIASGDPVKAAQLTAGGIGFGVAVFALPGLVAKLITNPKRLATVESILKSEFKRGGRSAAISRLIGFIGAQTEKRKFGSQRIPSTIP